MTTSNTVVPTVLTSAPPPWHTLLVLCGMLLLFVSQLPTMESVDRDATTEAFTKVLFPDLLTLKQMAYFRLLIAAIILGMSIHIMLGPGWTQETTYRKGSKLLRTPNMIRGIKTMCPFTSMSWNLLGASFTMSGIIALRVANEVAEGKDGSSAQISPWILRSALILWEMSAPFTLLVAAVIRYAIWPAVLHEKADTSNLKSFRNILMHNANVLFAMLETSLLGGVKVRFRHIAFAPIFGCIYVIFSWLMVFQWNTRDKGPQFIYFFFDTTLSDGKTATIALLMLLLVLIVFYAIFVSAEHILQAMGSSIIAHVSFVLAVCSLSMRFND